MVRNDMTTEESINMHGFLSAHCENGKLKYGILKKTAEKFGVSARTVVRLWKRVSDSPDGMSVKEALTKKYTGRKHIPQEELLAKLKGVPIFRRSTLRSTAFACGISKSSLHRALKRKSIVKYRSYVKPVLTPENRLERIRFSLSQIDDSIPTLPFKNMYNIVHVDEKWFNLCKIKNTFYLAPEEELPHRTVKSKRFIPKIMFLAAVARPRYDYHTKTFWDGKIGIWAITHQVAAKRNSRNRPAGTMETKPLNVNEEVYQQFMTEKVLPAIREKWPGRPSDTVFIQQDNARPHSRTATTNINECGKGESWNIELMNQPPNSPDLNILDLGFFNHIQSLQSKRCAVNVDDLIEAVQDAFQETSPTALSDNFITLQSVMREVLSHEGGNNFKIPHLKKAMKRRQGKEITRLFCLPTVYNNAKKVLEYGY